MFFEASCVKHLFFSPFSSEYQRALRSHYFLQLRLFWRIFLYKHFKEVAHYNSCNNIFSSSANFLSLVWLFRYSLSAEIHYPATPYHWLFCRWTHGIDTSQQVCGASQAVLRDIPPKATSTATRQCCSSAPSQPRERDTGWAWPQVLTAHRATTRDWRWARRVWGRSYCKIYANKQ